MAPELLKNRDYDASVDKWSLGILLYEMLHGYSPFKGNSESKTLGNIIQSQINFKISISENAKSMIMSLLQQRPIARPSWAQIYNHKWVLQFQKKYESKLLFNDFTLQDLNEGDCSIKLPFQSGHRPATQAKNDKFASATVCIAPRDIDKGECIDFHAYTKVCEMVGGCEGSTISTARTKKSNPNEKLIEGSLCMLSQMKQRNIKSVAKCNSGTMWNRLVSYVLDS